MQRTHYSFLMLVAFSMFTFVASCKKDKSEEPEPQNITTNKAQYKFYEIGAITFRNSMQTGSLIEGSSNGQKATLAVANDSTLVFTVIPEVFPAGDNALSFSVDGKDYGVVVKVVASQLVANPREAMDQFTITHLEQLNMLEAALAKDVTGTMLSPEVTEAFKKARELTDDFNSKFAQMNAEDQKIVANFLAANQPAFDELTGKLISIADYLASGDHGMLKTTNLCATGTALERYKCHWGEFNRHLNDFVFLAYSAAIAVSTMPVTGLAGFGVGAFAAAMAAPSGVAMISFAAKLLYIHFKIVCFLVYDNCSPANLKATTDPVVFQRDIDQPLPMKLELRNIQPQDASSQLGWLKPGMQAVNVYNAFWDKLSLTQFKITYKAENKAMFTPFSMSHMSISVAGNSNVTLSKFGGTVNAPVVTLTSSSQAEENFTLQVQYNDGVNVPVTHTLPAKLAGPATDSLAIYEAAVVGGWTVNQSGSTSAPKNMELFSNGTGHYLLSNGNTHAITWWIEKKNNQYYLFESGYWHIGFNQFRQIGTGMPNEALSYPVTMFKTYGDIGNGLTESLIYIKN